MNDTRKERRAPLSLKVRFKSATVDEFIEQNSSDISRGGLFIKSKKPMPVGTLLKFEFQLQDESRLIHGVGRVVWRREESDGNAAPGMGIKFIKMDAKSRALVDSILEQRSGKSGAFEAGQHPEELKQPSEKPFFPETTPEAELPKPEDSTQVRHAREFLASALSLTKESSPGAFASPAAPPAASSLSGQTEPAQPPSSMPEASKAGVTEPLPSSPPPRVEGLFGDAKKAATDAHTSARTDSVRPAGLRSSDSGAFGAVRSANPDSDAPTGRPTSDNTEEAARLAAEEALASMGQSLDDRALRESAGLQGTQASPSDDFGTADTGRPSAPSDVDLNIVPSGTMEDPFATPSTRPSAKPAAPSGRPSAPTASARLSSPPPEESPKRQRVAPLPAAAAPTAASTEGTPGWIKGALAMVLLAALGGVAWAFIGTPTGEEIQPEEPPLRQTAEESPSVPETTPAPAEDTDPPADPRPAETPARNVEIHATSRPPGASVIHRGRQVGTTPITLTLSIQENTELELHLAGHRRETVVVGGADDTAQVEMDLQPLPYLIEVTTEPPGARVVVRGLPAIDSPGTLTLRRKPTRDITLTVTKNGHVTQRVVVPRTAFVEGSDALRASARVELPEGRGNRPRPPRTPTMQSANGTTSGDATGAGSSVPADPTDTVPSQAGEPQAPEPPAQPDAPAPPPERQPPPERAPEPVREAPPEPAPTPEPAPAPEPPDNPILDPFAD